MTTGKNKRQLRERIGRWFHDRFGWHKPLDGTVRFQWMSVYPEAVCKYCGKRIIPASDFGDWMVFEHGQD